MLLGNPLKSQNRQAGLDLLGWLREKADVVANNVEGELDIGNMPEADFVVVLGGDGTILSTVRSLGSNQLPLIGVNMGKLGFLAEFSAEQFKAEFDRITNDSKLISERVMLTCRVIGPNQDYVTAVVNEVAIIAGPPFRMIEVSVNIGGEHLALCEGDGLIVATPTGSTAYNLSAGGPILAGGLEAAVITPLSAHSLSFRPIVVNLNKPIVLRYRDSRGNMTHDADKQFPAVVAVDGQENVSLSSNDEVIISPCETRFKLVLNPVHGNWRVLNTKLNWGALPNYVQWLKE